MSTNSYRGLHASHYDVVYAEKPYAEEARFVDALVVGAGARRQRLLDVACGTGRHARAFAELGWNVTGVDYNDELLDHARTNFPDGTFLRQDMRELDVPGRPFDVVTCLFDSIGYPQSDEGVCAALAGLRMHAGADGVVVVEFLHAPGLLRHASPLRVRRWALPDGAELLRISESSLDRERATMEVDYELIQLRADGTYEHWTERQSNRAFRVDEMRMLMESVAMRPDRFVAAYEPAGAIDRDTLHVLGLARGLA